MTFTDRIHCDNIVFCSQEDMKIHKTKITEKPLITKRILTKFPLTYKRDPKDERDYMFKGSIADIRKLQTIPATIDHSPNMSPVKNQGQLGSCVGFAVTAMKEWQEQQEHLREVSEGKKDSRKGKQYDLSESWVYWKSKEIDLWPGEEGTSIRFAMKVLNQVGVPTESAWPYDDIDIGKPKSWANMVARWALVGNYWRINNLTELKAALVTSPVPIGIPCFYEFFFPGKDGIIKDPANPSEMYGGHAVCAVGYDNSTRLIKFKNSWGTDWGENGYGYLSYEYVMSYLWDAWICTDLEVTRKMLKGDRELTKE